MSAIRLFRFWLVALIGFAWLLQPVGLRAGDAGGIILKCASFSLEFDTEGRPVSLKDAPSGRELLRGADAGSGFWVRNNFDHPQENLRGPSTRLSNLRLEGTRLTAKSADNKYSVEFEVKAATKYLTLRVAERRGLPADPNYSLHFEMPSGGAIRAFELDYMTSVARRNDRVEVNWYSLHERNPENPAGGFALYVKSSDVDEDDTILNIWGQEGLPHPRISGAWDVEAARSWVNRWMETFKERGQLIVAGKSMSELQECVQFGKQADTKLIYLYTDTWREGGFWPTVGNCAVNPRVFPRGMADLQSFSEYCRDNGMAMAVHCVTLGVGFRDRRYIQPKPDRRLAACSTGRLLGEVSASAKELVFQPAAGTRFPVITTVRSRPRPGLVWKDIYDIHYFRVGDEIIKVGEFDHTNGDRWVLKDCQRGLCSTKATAHADGTDTQGLWSPYGQVFVPDNNSSLLTEMVDEYADMVNRCRFVQTEYDGAEDQCFEGDWGFSKMASMVYSRLDHPVMAHTSSGRAPDCHIEYRLNAVRRMMAADDASATGSYGLPLWLDGQGGRPAPGLLEANFTMNLGVIAANGGLANLGLQKPFPQDGEFGITAAMFRAHGLTAEFFKLLKAWRSVSPRLTPAQLEQMRGSLVRNVSGNHPGSPLVYVLTENANGFALLPTKVLTRRSGDILWHREQELGAFGPWQTMRSGDVLELENPFPAQPLSLLLRVQPGEPDLVDPVFKSGEASLEVHGRIKAGDYLAYDGQGEGIVYDANWNVQQKLPITAAGWTIPHGWSQIGLRSAGRQCLLQTRFLARDAASAIQIGSPVKTP